MSEVLVCQVGDIANGSVRIVTVEGKEIGVIRHDDRHYAYLNRCAHQGGPACEGVRMWGVIDDVDENGVYRGQKYDETDMHIVCPWHGYEYHLRDGVNVCDPKIRLKKYEVIERDGHVYLSI